MRILRRCLTSGLALGAVMVVAACGSSSNGSSSSSSKSGGGGATSSASSASSKASASPITIGASLSLSGDFSADGQAFERGYQLWAADQNKAGGLLGHPIKLDVISDASSPAQVVTNYQKLIGSDKDQLVFGPFSTLLTVPAARIARATGTPSSRAPAALRRCSARDCTTSSTCRSRSRTTSSRSRSGSPRCPPSKRPKTAAYATVNDPFTQPQLPAAQKILEAAGVKTVLNKVFPAEVTDYTPIAGQVASAKPDVVVLGSVDVPTVSAFIHAFIQQHYNPKVFIATAGPDQGARSSRPSAPATRTGSSSPTAGTAASRRPTASRWSRSTSPSTAATPSDVNADVAEAYSVGQVLAQAVQATHGFDKQKIISYLHSGVTLNSVQGPVKFDSLGENTAQQTLTFQWQKGRPGADDPDGHTWVDAAHLPEAGLEVVTLSTRDERTLTTCPSRSCSRRSSTGS